MKNLTSYDSFLNEAAKAKVVLKKYPVTDKATLKIIKKSVNNGGFSEFDDLMDGKMSLAEFIEFASEMGSSEAENSREQKIANAFSNALYALHDYLVKTKQITTEEAAELMSAAEDIYNDEFK